MTSKTTNKFSAEVRAGAVRMVLDDEKDRRPRRPRLRRLRHPLAARRGRGISIPDGDPRLIAFPLDLHEVDPPTDPAAAARA